ncbi:MAG: VanZ family protein [Dokdonella sp.]
MGTVMPQSAVAWLRMKVPLFALVWDALDAVMPWFNPLHIIFYAWVAALWRLLFPKLQSTLIFCVGGICGVVSESLQLLAPGRTARVADVLNDLVGIAFGLLAVAIVHKVRISRPISRT